MNSFSLVFSEKTKPHCARVKTLKPADLELGEQQVRVALRMFARCLDRGIWPGPGGEQSDAEFVEIKPFHRTRIENRLAVLESGACSMSQTKALATTTDQPKPSIRAGGQVAALVPQTLDEAFRVSQAIALSGLAPNGLNKQEQIMVAIMAGAELGLAPFQALQSFAVINGRPTLWGDGLVAVARAQGVKVKQWAEGDDDDHVAWCTVTRPDTSEEITRSFSVKDAIKAGLWGKAGPWQSYPKRMLAMRARAWALRDGCADMLRGFHVREEVEDYQQIRDVTPAKSGVMERLETHGHEQGQGFSDTNVDGAIERPLPPDAIDAEIETALVDPPADDGLPVRDDTPIDDDAAADDADDFPGDKALAGFKTGTQALADQIAELTTWASALTDQVRDMDRESIDAALSDPSNIDRFNRLAGAKPEVAEALNRTIDRRKQELA
jgi:hypothetical protein